MLRAILVMTLICGFFLHQPISEAQTVLPADDESAETISADTLAFYEQLITMVMIEEEFVKEREQICAVVERIQDPTTKEVQWARCITKAGSVSFEFISRGLIFRMITENGSVIVDRGSNGDIDFAETVEHQKVFSFSFKDKQTTGGEFKADWLKSFTKRIRSIIEQNPRLKNLGSFYLYKFR